MLVVSILVLVPSCPPQGFCIALVYPIYGINDTLNKINPPDSGETKMNGSADMYNKFQTAMASVTFYCWILFHILEASASVSPAAPPPTDRSATALSTA